MSIKLRLNWAASFSALAFIPVVNVLQYVFGFEVHSESGMLIYGLPFAFYEYIFMFNLGRVLPFGLVGDILVSVALGIAGGLIYAGFLKSNENPA